MTPARDDDVLLVDAAQTAAGAFAVDSHQRIVFWNAEAEALLGYTQAETLGKRCGEVLKACHGSAVDGCARRCAAMSDPDGTQLAQRFELPATTCDGTIARLRVLALVAHNAAGDPRLVHLLYPQAGAQRVDGVGPAPAASEPAPHPDTRPTARGRTHCRAQLTKREQEVLRLLARGLTMLEIAEALSISPITARNHVTSVIEKLGVKTRLQAVVVASRMGWL